MVKVGAGGHMKPHRGRRVRKSELGLDTQHEATESRHGVGFRPCGQLANMVEAVTG
jgi:hypothetical protein